MLISRRNLLRNVGLSAAAAAATHSLRDVCQASSVESKHLDPASGLIRLDRNENPYGPSDNVTAAMRDHLQLVNRFPEGELEALVSAIAKRHAVQKEQVILGCGSTEILRMCAMAFLGLGKRLVTATPGFEVMAQYGREFAADVQAVALTKRHEHDLPAMSRRAAGASGMVYICNPHNPTGSMTARSEIESFVSELPSTVYVVIDEAYYHYADVSSAHASFIEQPLGDARVIATRTFSKIHGLAGMRIGYAIASRETARRVAAFHLRDGVNVAAATAARIALEDQVHVRASAQQNADSRQEFFNQANARMLRWLESHANFVLLNAERSSSEVVEHFRKNHILVAGGFSSMDKYIRVSLGTPAEMREFWRVWDLAPVQHMTM